MLKKLLFCLSIIATGLFLPMSAHAGECQLYETTHPGYPLDGAHLQGGKCSLCSSCHTNATFVGTPKLCEACHGSSGLRASVYRSTAHFAVPGAVCSDCHNTTSYTATWNMNHGAVTAGTRCDSCHGGSYSSGYNAQSKADFVSSSTNPSLKTHMATASDCLVCHTAPGTGSHFSLTSWQNVSITSIHNGLTLSSTCSTCHDGNIATGKNSATNSTLTNGHPVTSLECGSCHSFTANFKCAQAYDIMINYASMFYQRTIDTLKTMLA